MNTFFKLILFLYWMIKGCSCQASTFNLNYKQQFCPAKCVSGFPPDYCWAETEANTNVSGYLCPSGFIGTASWICGNDGRWTTPTPDLSNCINPVVENSINQANDNITKGGNPSESLNALTNVFKENELATGDIVQLDQTIQLAIDIQADLMSIDNTDSNSRDSSSKVFAKSMIDLYDVVLLNKRAYWGLEWILRSEAIDQVQKNVDDTLFLLAENLLDGIYQNYGPFLNILWLPALIWHLIGKPFQRGFYCDDTSIRYPYKDSTINDIELICYSLGVPIILIITVEIVRWKNNSKWKGVIHERNSAAISISSSTRIPPVVVKIIHLIAIFLFGEGCSELMTDLGKYSVGRLRPHFLDVCQPENLTELCPTFGGPPIYITDFICTGTDEKKLLDSRLSFPSGHASFSAYSMLYLVIYLQCRMNWSGSKLLRPVIQIAALLFSWYTGLSRVFDYKHHWSDVLAGFVIGYATASLTALYVSKFFKPKSYGKIPLLPQNGLGDVELRQNHSETSDQQGIRLPSI